MNVPVVLPKLKITVAEDGTISATLDDQPYAPTHTTGRKITRNELRNVIDEITSERQTAIRVEVTESDGTTYADIATPPASDNAPAKKPPPDQPTALPGVSGTGFRPGEQVALAYLLMTGTAADDGTASIHLPAAVLASREATLVLLGLDSHTLTTITTQPATA